MTRSVASGPNRDSGEPALRPRVVLLAPPSRTGLVIAAVAYTAGLAPSLLPRPAMVQIALGGILAALGYGLGAGTVALAGRALPRSSSWRHAWTGVAVVAWVAAAAMTATAMGWQREQADSLGLSPTPPAWWTALLGSIAVGAVLVLVARSLRGLARWVARVTGRLPRPLPRLLGAAAATVVVAGVVVGGFAATKAVFGRLDTEVGGPPPASTLRSGGPGSLVPWDSLGAEGRAFVSGGPTTAALDAFNDRPAVEPIRVFAGLASAPTPQQRAELVVAELERTDGFDREVVIAVVPTGNGFVDPALVGAPEYVTAGDVATAATQYSVLPSWLSYLVDQRAADDEGRALVQALRAAIDARPAADRPRLVVAGESLGAYGAQSPFSGMDPTEVVEQVDGSVFFGSPSSSALWSAWRADRSGGPVWQPDIGAGDIARSAAAASSVPAVAPGWGPRRVLLSQHANDAVAWWAPSLAWSRPDWLDDPLGPGTDPRMTWWPGVFFLQVGLDLATAGAQPPGIGHNYVALVAPAWAAVLDVPGWTRGDTERLTTELTR